MVKLSVAFSLLAAALFVPGPAGAAGSITVNPTNLDFGAVPVGTSTDIAVVITNTGSAAATPNYAGGAPIDPTNFGGSQNCAGVTLDPGDTCAFTYNFKPTTTGALSTTTTIDVDGTSYAITMKGTGAPPATTTTTTATTVAPTTTRPNSNGGGGGGTPPAGGGTTTTVAGAATLHATVEHDEVAPGESEIASATGYQPKELVSAVMQPDGADLGSRVADDQGVARFEWKIPDDAVPGKREFVATGATSGTAKVEFTVAKSDDSGLSPWVIAAIVVALLLIIAGIVYAIARRRRRRQSGATAATAATAPPAPSAPIEPTEPMKPVDPTDPTDPPAP
jgi:hypothetical protein